MVISGGNQEPYFNGDTVMFNCVPPAIGAPDPFECVCDAATNPDDPVWLCNTGDPLTHCQ